MSNDHQDDGDYGLDEYRPDEETKILYRLDERTERMDARMKRIEGTQDSQSESIDDHDDQIQRNTTILNAITFGLGTAITTGVAKLGGLIKF